MLPVRCSVVIATLDRANSLAVVLNCLATQTRAPSEVIVSAAGDIEPVQAAAHRTRATFPITVIPSTEKSAARQRNAAAHEATGDVIAFLDDDIEFGSDLLMRALSHFDCLPSVRLGALSPRIAGEARRRPGRFARFYYRLQAGYPDPDYGGRLFGPGINCYPIFRADSPDLVPSEWLPSTCLFVRADLFAAERFPEFTGYSFAEDVHLSARIARHAPIYFASDCEIIHHSLTSEFKTDRRKLTAGKLNNMEIIAREIVGLDARQARRRMLLHRIFMTIVLLTTRSTHWAADLRGIWRRIA